MTKSSLWLSSTAIATVLAAGGAQADVTPEDVWANTIAYMGSLGGAVTGTLATSASTTRIEDWEVVFALPMGAGQIDMSVTSAEMVDNGDGTITFRYPSGTTLTAGIDIPGEMNASVDIQMTGGDIEMVASGDPGDISYSYTIPTYALQLTDLSVDGDGISESDAEMMANADIDALVTIRDSVGTMRVTEGDLIETVIEGAFGSVAYDVSFALGDEVSGFQKGTVGAGASTTTLVMPAGGPSVMALPQALRDGMRIALQTETSSTTSDQEMMLGGTLAGYTRLKVGAGSADISFDQNGLIARGGLQSYDFETLDPEFPFPIKAAIGAAEYDVAAPVMGSDAPQPFTYNLSLTDVELDETLWSLFDPGQALPRDAATLRMALSGEMGTTMDLLDFPAWMAIEQTGENPFSIHSVDINEVYLAAVGAVFTGQGAFTFNMDDLTTFDGVPAPTGEVEMQVTGANALIDTLIAAGFISDEDAMGARMFMGLFARPGEGADDLVSNIVVDGATGAVSANGQRLR
ncbi:MAG: DUF2125 domain-containing protein [Pseudomonadota bacterium]